MDDDTGYELNDPKHPTYHERFADAADQMRKRAKEEGGPQPDYALQRRLDPNAPWPVIYARAQEAMRDQHSEVGIPVIVISDEGVNPGILTSLDAVIVCPCDHDMKFNRSVTGRQHDGQEVTVDVMVCSKCGYEEAE